MLTKKLDISWMKNSLEYGKQSTGLSFPKALFDRFNSLFLIDLSMVRVRISSLPSLILSKAFTHGTDIYIDPTYWLDEKERDELLTHELGHVFQQLTGQLSQFKMEKLTLLLSQHLEVGADTDSSLERSSSLDISLRQKATNNINWSVVLPQILMRSGNTYVALTDTKAAFTAVENSVQSVQEALSMHSRIPVSQAQSMKRLVSEFEFYREEVLLVLKKWMSSSDGRKTRYIRRQNFEDRRFNKYIELSIALVGEARSMSSLAIEKELASQVKESKIIDKYLNSVLKKIHAKLVEFCNKPHLNLRDRELEDEVKGKLRNIFNRHRYTSGRYHYYYSVRGIKKVLIHPESCSLANKIAVIHDVMDLFTDMEKDFTRVLEDKDKATLIREDEAGKYRQMALSHMQFRNAGTIQEQSPIIQSARCANMPVHLGPSYTTGRMLQLGVFVGANANELTAIAWGLFAFWTLDYSLKETRVHRFHFVMDMANNYGVEYDTFHYPAKCPGYFGAPVSLRRENYHLLNRQRMERERRPHYIHESDALFLQQLTLELSKSGSFLKRRASSNRKGNALKKLSLAIAKNPSEITYGTANEIVRYIIIIAALIRGGEGKPSFDYYGKNSGEPPLRRQNFNTMSLTKTTKKMLSIFGSDKTTDSIVDAIRFIDINHLNSLSNNGDRIRYLMTSALFDVWELTSRQISVFTKVVLDSISNESFKREVYLNANNLCSSI